MDVREKLIEICFREFCDLAGDSPCGCDRCPYGKYSSENGECYEEYKKDKFGKVEKTGVTVQKWISVKDRLPDDIGYYLVVYRDKYNGISSIALDNYVKCGAGEWWANEFTHNITHWMPIPEPPKGE